LIPPGANAVEFVRQLRASAETVANGPGPTPSASAEETEKVLRWLESDGVRLVHVEGEWSCPVGGATKHLRLHDLVQESRADLVPFDDRRNLRTDPRPVP
jgi:DNA polymerase III subunit epsilon